MRPDRYFYLVDIDSDEIKAIFTADHFEEPGEIATFERRIREQHGVDASNSELVLRDSAEHPLRAEVWAQLIWRRA